ncbi:GIY-YIG nuclease family protein [Patescibacteria group bacterium]|nr:GIY-YIG nuclease family protein [Patescibacteria group bacterium]
MTKSFYYVYVLLSLKDRRFYIGLTSNLKKRFTDHNKGRNISTAGRLPFQLIFYESFLDKIDALRRERYFKTSKGKITLRLMLKEYLLRQGSSVG